MDSSDYDPSFDIDDGTNSLYRKANQLRGLNSFGIGCISLRDASEMIVFEHGEADNFPWHGPEILPKKDIIAAFHQSIIERSALLQQRMIADIDSGRLKVNSVRRSLEDGGIDVDNTYTALSDLADWLQLYGFDCNEALEEYIDDEANLADKIALEVRYQRTVQKTPHRAPTEKVEGIDDNQKRMVVENRELEEKYREAISQAEQLRKQLEESGGRSKSTAGDREELKPKERTTCYRIISALCLEAGIPINEKGAAQRIAEVTELKGDAVHRDTIANTIKKMTVWLDR